MRIYLFFLDRLTSRRLEEAQTLMSYITENFQGMFFGLGIGFEYIPWKNDPKYETYFVHYAHFSIPTYWMMGGFGFMLYIHFFLLRALLRAFKALQHNSLPKNCSFAIFWVFAIVILNLGNSVLIINPFFGTVLAFHTV